MLAWAQHVVAHDHHTHVSGVHDAIRGHVIELLSLQWEPLDIRNDVLHCGLCHLFCWPAGLWNTAWNFSFHRGLDVDSNTGSKDILIRWMLICIVHLDESVCICKARRIANSINTEEARHDHCELRWIELSILQFHSVGAYFLDDGIELIVDVIHVEHPFTHLLCIPEATDPEVCGERLCGDVRDRCLVLDVVLCHLIARVEEELVCCAETCSPLSRGYHDRTRVFEEFRPRFASLLSHAQTDD